jgi:signal transduction histidine kinase/CheY-like chemotaxis protein
MPRDRESGGGSSPLTVKHSPSVFSARLIAVTGGELGRSFSVGPEGATLGRDQECTLQLAREDISRRHARVYLAGDGRWFVEDLKSSNGTLVNGVIVKRAEIAFGDRIQLGENLMFIFARHDDLGDKVLELQKMEAIGQLAGGVAHDFQNLLAVVSNNLVFLKEGLAKDAEPGALKECVDEAQLAVKRAVDLTRQLLTFAKGREPKKKQLVDLSALVTEVLQMCRRTFGDAVTFQPTVAPGQKVSGDRTRLHQVVMNLCLNARDAMADGGTLTVTLEPEVPTARVHAVPPLVRSGVCVVLTVTDSGCGMDEQTRGRIFEPFFSTKGPAQGTGLGLATSYSIIKQHGGDVEVTSRPGQGATFRVLLPKPEAPLTVPEKRGRGKSTATVAPIPAEDRPGVLIVDSNPQALKTAESMLKSWNYETFTAENGKEAILVFERNKRQIGAVILDLDLNVLSSKDTFRILRTVHTSVRIILTAGRMDSGLATELLTKGAEGFLPKPLPADALKEMLNLIFTPQEDEDQDVDNWEDVTLQRDEPPL